MREDDIKVVADFLHRAVQLSLLLQKEAGSKLLKDFVRVATVPTEGKQGFQLANLVMKRRYVSTSHVATGASALNVFIMLIRSSIVCGVVISHG